MSIEADAIAATRSMVRVMSQRDVERIAIVCHEANRAFCRTRGDYSEPCWAEAPEAQRQSAMKGVLFCFAEPDAPVWALHEHGHPRTEPFETLPLYQQQKVHLFKAIVAALA